MPTDIFKRLEATGKLPTPPGVVLRLLEVTRRPDASVREVAEIIGTDPGLTSKIVRFINSPMAGIGREIKSVHQAVTLLGTRTVKMMALSFSVMSGRPRNACASFDSKQFCLQSFACAVAAKHLSTVTKIEVPQEAYVAGLLSQIGRLALAGAIPEEYDKILASLNAVPRDLPQAERAAIETTYAEVGGHLLRTWGLPESLCGAVEAFRTVDATPDTPPLAPLLYAAELVAEIVCGNGGGEESPVPQFVQAARQYFTLSDDQCAAIVSETVRELEESRELFELPIEGMRSVEEIESEVRDRITELGLAMHLENQSLVQRQEELLHRATTDPLTGVGNRAAFDARLTLELERAARDGSVAGLLMIDIDHFKRVNDTHGHLAGDRVLSATAKALDRCIRKVDYLARFGGEEFVIIAPSISKAGLAHLAERLRAAVEVNVLKWEKEQLGVTISVGGAVVSEVHDVQAAAHSLVRTADENLYIAKSDGRNRVSFGPARESTAKACVTAK